MRSYELVFIVDPELDGDALAGVVDTVKDLVGRSNGKVVKVDSWGLRRLAYPIRNKWEGQYVLMVLEIATGGVAELERNLHLAEPIMRHLIVRLEDENVKPDESETKSDAG